jgi:hypothetical protein
MKISGFTFLRNGIKYQLPFREAILSILPICDEFVVALGRGDDNDTTEAAIRALNSTKIKIIHTTWNTDKYTKNTEYARQTDIAKAHCTGDWLFYIQGDEAVHEDDLVEIKSACKHYLNNQKVEGFIFNYLHFWGDYSHVHLSHAWYRREIRIIRNSEQIHSWKDAQSFRFFQEFDFSPNDYMRSENSRKLNVVALKARVFHYGYVRHPLLMSSKKRDAYDTYHGQADAAALLKNDPNVFDYGPLNRISVFNDSHPQVMGSFISKHDWKEYLQYSGNRRKNRPIHKHEKAKYRLLSWLENNLLGGKMLGGFTNYKVVENYSPQDN